MTSQPPPPSSRTRLLILLGGALVIAVVALLILTRRTSTETPTEPSSTTTTASEPRTSLRPPSLPTPTGQASVQNRSGSREESTDDSAPVLLKLPVLNDLDVPCSDALSDQFIAHINALRDAGIDTRTLVEQIVTQSARQAYGNPETAAKPSVNFDEARRRMVDNILGEGIYDNWRANRLESPTIDPRTDGSLDPAFTAKIRRLQKSGVDELLLAKVVAGQMARQLGVATNLKLQQLKAGEITSEQLVNWQRELGAKRQSYVENAISGVLGSQVFTQYDRSKILTTYPCGIVALLSENQADQLYKIRKEWQELNQSLSIKLKATEIDNDQFHAQIDAGRSNYHARKLALLGSELDPKFP